MVWIYCFRKRHYSGRHTATLTLALVFYNVWLKLLGTSLEIHSPTKDTINPAYHTITDDHFKKPVEEPTSQYEEVIIHSEVKMTPNPAYAVPWFILHCCYVGNHCSN